MINTIYTIGHSTRPIAYFIAVLRSFDVRLLTDMRSMPGSKWQPQFNRSALERSLRGAGIDYLHISALGGKKPHAGPVAGEQDPIPGYSAYMKTDIFRDGIKELERHARQGSTAYMCAEADWRNCHRSRISDHLFHIGWEVIHIADVGKSERHTPTPPSLHQGSLF